MTDTLDATDVFEKHRRELTGYCYRMLGSAFEADDAVQETMVRAWRNFDRFEGRSAVRTWLYRIATNVCLDSLSGRQRRAMPIDLGPAKAPVSASLGTPRPEATWLEPIPDGKVLAADTDPADQVVARESVRLAFVAALQHLPARQRVVLILRDVLHWHADEVAELLETSVASVNSALQRSRATLDKESPGIDDIPRPMDANDELLLARYVDAFERYDIDSLVALLLEDATMSMPPYELWIQGPADVAAWLLGPGAECKGSRMVPTAANGMAAFGQYRPSGPGGRHQPWALQVVEVANGGIARIDTFLDTARMFPLFGLPIDPPPPEGT